MEISPFSQFYDYSIFVNTLQEFAKTALVLHFIGEVFYSILRLLLFIIIFLGFGFYLWFLSNSDDQTQNRLLNILYGYLAVACMGFSPMIFITYHANDDLLKLCFRIGSQFMMAISTSFLLISFATILNHFKPDLYLEFSLRWKHKIAVSILLVTFALTEQLVHYCCPENFVDCQVSQLRRFLIIPSTLASFVCQLIVIIDIIFPWKHICSTLRRFIRPNQLAPMNDGDLEIVSLPGSTSDQPSSATPQLDQHLVVIFLS